MIDIASRYEALLSERLDILLDDIATFTAYVVLYEPVRTDTHHDDEPFDDSGHVTATNKRHAVSDFQTVEDFGQEYTGGSELPTFISGRGFSHETYRDVIEAKTDAFYVDVLLRIAEEVIAVNDEEALEQIGYPTDETPAHPDDLIDYFNEYMADNADLQLSSELTQNICDRDFREMYARGEERAKQIRATEQNH